MSKKGRCKYCGIATGASLIGSCKQCREKLELWRIIIGMVSQAKKDINKEYQNRGLPPKYQDV